MLDILVDEANEPPVFTSSSDPISVNENITEVIYTATATDPEDDTLTYSLDGSDAEAFSIDSSSGALSFASAPNFEAPTDADTDNTYQLSLQVFDGNSIISQELSISVTDVNEAPSFTSSASADVTENSTGTIHTAAANDPENKTISYDIDGIDSGHFSIDSSSGALSFNSSPDFEAPTDAGSDNTYQLSLEAWDGTYTTTQALAINVTNVNEAPTITSTATEFTIPENTTSSFHTVTATDPENTTLVYSLAGIDADELAIDSSGALSFASAPNFELPTDNGGDNVYSVTLEVSDGSNTDTQDLTIEVTGVDEAPTITNTATSVSFTENATGTVFDASATDPENSTLTYSLSGADAEDFEISTSGAITFKSTPNYDISSDANGDNIYELTVEVSDGTTISSQALTITVKDVNEAPTITSASSEDVAENSSGTIHTASASDPESDSLIYSLSGTDSDDFNINSSSGALSFNSSPDFESPTDADTNNIYQVTLGVSDGNGNTASQELTITVTDDDEQPSFTSDLSVEVNENTDTGIIVYTATASDPEGKTLSYQIVAGNDIGAFQQITSAGNQGTVRFAAIPNFESPADANTDNTYELTISVSDGTTDAVTQAITIVVIDVNEAPTITSADTEFTVLENTTGSFHTVTATDPENTTLNYNLSGADTEDFTIDNDGILSFASAPNFEVPTDADTNNIYTITIEVADGANTDTQDLTITVTGVDEAPTINNTASSVDFNENETGTVFDASATDPENATITYSLSGADADDFSIDSAGLITFNTSPDYDIPTDADTNNDYLITIEVSDGTNTSTQALTITVADVNEAPTITDTTASISVVENVEDTVFDASATDPENATLNYSLSGTDAENLIIDSSGLITFVSSPDYDDPADADTNNFYTITIEVSDGANSVSQALTIEVTNVNEAPTFTSTDAISVFENEAGVIYTIAIEDEDASDSHTYALAGGTDQALFSLSGAELSFIAAPDYETPQASGDNVYEVQLRATDSGSPSLSTDLSLSITVEDVNEAPTITNTNTAVSTAEDTVNNASAFEYAITATDPENEALIYALGGADATDFDVSGDGVITFKSGQSGTGYDPNFEHPADDDINNVYQLDLYAQDASGITSTRVSITITVTNELEAPTFASASDESLISENTSSVFYLAEASDDDGDNVSYSLAAGTGDNDLFKIDSTTYGELSFKSAPDYENYEGTGEDGTYNVTISASDGSLSSTLELAVTVTDVNEAPAFASASASTTAPENSTATFYTAAASDPEEDSLSYSLASGVADNDFFSITTGGELSFQAAQDRESAANDANTDYTYEVQITASDGTYSTETALSLSVTLENVNEAPTVTNTVTAISVVEDTNSSPVSFQYTITASDPENDSLVYSISGTDAAAFDVDPGTGLITFKAGVSGTAYDPNYEYPSDANDDNLYQLSILASDSALDSSSVAIEVSVTDVSAAPNFVNSSGASLGSGDNFADSASFAENDTAAAYTAITVDDDDTDDFVKYHITGGVDASLFEIIDDQTGEIFFKSSPDYELAQDDGGDNTYIVEVNATDSNDTTVITLSITIDNLNDNAPVIAAQAFTIDEDTADNGAVGSVIVTDADADATPSGLATTYQNWQITAGDTNGAFAIDASGAIAVADTSQIDYESGTTSYSLTVEVSDGDNTGSGTVTVNINDTNDEAPVINSASPNLAENASANDLVATLTADDPEDNTLGTTLQSWTITSGNTDSIFALDPTSGELTVADTTNLDYDVGAQSYSLLVTVSDGTNTSAEQTITVNITDVNDITPSIDSGQVFTIREDALDGTEVDTVAYSDADTGNVFTWSIQSGNDDAAFAIGETLAP